jgi:hypothetical protein
MRRFAFALAAGFVVLLGSELVQAQRNDALSLTVRIYDYAGLPTESVQSAQEQVSDLYSTIGVQTVWAATVRRTESPDQTIERDPREFVINVLTAGMSGRLGVAQEVLGLAAVTPYEGGKVAYVLFDRVCDVAATSAIRLSDVLGVVIAHELGHLLMPSGSHSRIGLMRPVWHATEFRAPSQQQLTFTPAQAEKIRGLLTRSTRHTSDRHAAVTVGS